MRALVMNSGELALREQPTPVLARDEVLLDVALAGICGTDMELLRGYAGFSGIPGHEFVGRVADPGASGLAPGDRVVAEINLACGHCESCQRGMRTHCETRTVLGVRDRAGVFAEQVSVPRDNLHRVPDEITDHQAVFVEPLAAALQVPEQVEVAPGMRVLVVGAGRLGQLVARVLGLHAIDLQVVARHERQRECLDQSGVASIAEAQVAPRSVDLAVDTSGHPSGLALALEALAPRGTLVAKSTFRGSLELDPQRLVVDELTVVGSRCGPFGQALEAIASGQIDPSPLLDAVYPLERFEEAFAKARTPGALKVLLDPQASTR